MSGFSSDRQDALNAPRVFDSLTSLNAAVALVNKIIALSEPGRSLLIRTVVGEGDSITKQVLECFLTVLSADLCHLASPTVQTGHVRDFILECCDIMPSGGGVPARSLYQAYTRWATHHSYPPLSETSFGRAASSLTDRRDTNSGRVYSMLRLKDQWKADS